MPTFILNLFDDESGYVVSAELVLIATITVLAMVVGLSDISVAVHNELGDVAVAFGTTNQSFRYAGLTGSPNTSQGTLQNSVDFCDATGTLPGTGVNPGFSNGSMTGM